ncbi:MAG: DUF2029 domain-containing protein [Peptococcaceae bacterium]|nr:DUF2029 domain-containing protein [Peptococcaceae bacterium]
MFSVRGKKHPESRVVLYSLILYLIFFYLVGCVCGILFYAYGSDFLCFYIGGTMVSGGDIENLYNLDRQKEVNDAIRSQNGIPFESVFLIFVNPPFYALFMSPLTNLPYNAALWIWRTLGIAVFIISIRALAGELKLTGNKWLPLSIIGLTSFPVFIGLVSAQNSLFSLGIYAAIYILLKNKRDFTAGLALGIGLFKPQLFFLLPLVLVMLKRWRAVAGWLSGCASVFLVSYVFMGGKVIAGYVKFLLSEEYRSFAGNFINMHSVPSFFRMLTGDNSLIFPIAIITSASVLALIYTGIRREYGLDAIFSLVITGTILSSPHLFDYDLTLLIIPGILIYNWHKSGKMDGRQTDFVYALLTVLYVVSWLSLIYIHYLRIQLTVPLMVLLLLTVWQYGKLTATSPLIIKDRIVKCFPYGSVSFLREGKSPS